MEYDSGSDTDILAEHTVGQILCHSDSTIFVYCTVSNQVDSWVSVYNSVQDEQKRKSSLAVAWVEGEQYCQNET